MTGRRRSDVAALLVAFAVILGLAYALRGQPTPIVAADPATTEVTRPSAPPSDTRPSVLFIGDSYTSGNGLREMSPSCMAAVKMGWLCDLSAVPGTGYISGGPANRFTVNPYTGTSTSFAERIPGLAAKYNPDIVVLDGGRNDQFAPKEDVYNAMAATIAEARRAWPSAKLVLVRPRYLAHPDDDLGFDDAFITGLLAEPGAGGTTLLDPIGRFATVDTAAMLAADRTHPNQKGELELASAIVASLLSSGFAVNAPASRP